MSEENDQDNTQPLDTEPLEKQKMRKTSAVPLRKETVRVTLKSTPAGAKKPPAPQKGSAPVPTAMTPETQPQDAAGPTAHNPDVPDVTSAVPLKQETMRVTLKAEGSAPSPAPAPTVPLSTPGAPKVAAPAPTVPLNVGPAAGGPATIPLATQPLGNASQPLPKATVQLQQTQQLTPTSSLGTPDAQAPTIQTVSDEDAADSEASNLETILAVAAFLVSLFLLFAQFQRASIWVDEHESGSYSAIFSEIE